MSTRFWITPIDCVKRVRTNVEKIYDCVTPAKAGVYLSGIAYVEK